MFTLNKNFFVSWMNKFSMLSWKCLICFSKKPLFMICSLLFIAFCFRWFIISQIPFVKSVKSLWNSSSTNLWLLISLNWNLKADNFVVNLSIIAFLFEGKFKNCLYSSSTFMVSSTINCLILWIFTKFLNIENLYSDKKEFHLLRKWISKLLNDNLFLVSLYLLLNLLKGVIITGRTNTFLLFFVDIFPTDISLPKLLLCVLKFFIEFTFGTLFSFKFNSLFSLLASFFSEVLIDFLNLPESIAFLFKFGFIFKYLLSNSSITEFKTSFIKFWFSSFLSAKSFTW